MATYIRKPFILISFAALVLTGILAILAEPLLQALGPAATALASVDLIRDIATAIGLFAGAHLLTTLIAFRLMQSGNRRKATPKILLDMVRVVIFTLTALISLSLFFQQNFSGFLTGSGLILAVLGFAIRNVVADVFSGLALSIEAPFRIGDWIQIETLGQGRVIEISWRTTRLVTRDSTYVILPNSQISRQKITNFSAPKLEYRDHADITLPSETSVEQVRTLIKQALAEIQSIVPEKKPEILVTRYDPEGITYRVKYWLKQHDQEVACRNEVFLTIDKALRENGIQLISRLPHSHPGPKLIEPAYAANDR